jgi:hypothetical protein
LAEAEKWLERGVAAAALRGDEKAADDARMFLARVREPVMVAARAALFSIPPFCAACSAGLATESIAGLCSRCRAVRYCGPECQRAAWKEHKAACHQASEGAAGGGEGAVDAATLAQPGSGLRRSLVDERAAISVLTLLSCAELRTAASRATASPAEQFASGKLYLDGAMGSERSYSAGYALITAAAERGFAHAQSDLATLCIEAGDEAGCLRWARAASEQGYSTAFGTLAALYQFSKNFKDVAKAAPLWKRAAEEGVPEAIDYLEYRRQRAKKKAGGRA